MLIRYTIALKTFINSFIPYLFFISISLCLFSFAVFLFLSFIFFLLLTITLQVLAFKIYRHIAGKLSALVVSVVTQVAVDSSSPNSALGSPRNAQGLPSDISMIRLDSELMTGVSGNEPKVPEPDVPFAIASDSQDNRKRNRKSMRPSSTKSKPFKSMLYIFIIIICYTIYFIFRHFHFMNY